MRPVEQSAHGGPLGQMVVAALNGSSSTRLKRLLTAYAVGTVGWEHGKKVWAKVQDRRRYTVSVAGDDEVYDELHEWLLERMPEKDRRSVVARSAAKRSGDLVQPVEIGDAPPPPPRVRLFYDSSAAQTVVISGHPVRVRVDKPDWANRIGQSSSEWLQQKAREEERMVFTCDNEHAHAAVLAFLADLVAAHEETRKPRLRIAGRWGGWNHRNDLPLRPLNTVVLRGNQRDELAADLAQFLASEEHYNRMGVPWHRGYLFYGPPGTGKTSLARALATEFNLDVWYIPLSDLDQDTKLLGLVSEVSAGSMLLLEDIDTLPAAKDRSEDAPDAGAPFGGVSAAGLLNSLDGVATPHGLISVGTTNHIDRLDPALIRPGRFDRLVLIDYLVADQFVELVRTFLPGSEFDLDMDAWEAGEGMTAGDVVGVLKTKIDDPAAALVALKELVG